MAALPHPPGHGLDLQAEDQGDGHQHGQGQHDGQADDDVAKPSARALQGQEVVHVLLVGREQAAHVRRERVVGDGVDITVGIH